MFNEYFVKFALLYIITFVMLCTFALLDIYYIYRIMHYIFDIYASTLFKFYKCRSSLAESVAGVVGGVLKI